MEITSPPWENFQEVANLHVISRLTSKEDAGGNNHARNDANKQTPFHKKSLIEIIK